MKYIKRAAVGPKNFKVVREIDLHHKNHASRHEKTNTYSLAIFNPKFNLPVFHDLFHTEMETGISFHKKNQLENCNLFFAYRLELLSFTSQFTSVLI